MGPLQHQLSLEAQIRIKLEGLGVPRGDGPDHHVESARIERVVKRSPEQLPCDPVTVPG